jgi:hypothetical protein
MNCSLERWWMITTAEPLPLAALPWHDGSDGVGEPRAAGGDVVDGHLSTGDGRPSGVMNITRDRRHPHLASVGGIAHSGDVILRWHAGRPVRPIPSSPSSLAPANSRTSMIARIWRGVVRREDSDATVAHFEVADQVSPEGIEQ